MIISHKYKFIFIKTKKTAGSSIEAYLSQYCGDNDIVTPIYPVVEPHFPRNYRGFWNPLPEIFEKKRKGIRGTLNNVLKRKKFHNHIPARIVKARISNKIWKTYFKFCVERNPYDKTISHYYMMLNKFGDSISFDDFLTMMDEDKINYPINYPIYTDLPGNLLVDRVLKYESLTNELSEIFNHLEIPFEDSLNIHAKSEYRKDRRPYQEVYTPTQKKIVQERYAKEFAIHGYHL